MVYCAGPASLTSGHVAEDILDQAAVGEGTLPLFSGALVGMEEQHQLLLNQLPLLRVRRLKVAWAGAPIYFVH